MSGSEEQGGGFARGFVLGLILAALGFVGASLMYPLEPRQAAPDTEAQSAAPGQTVSPPESEPAGAPDTAAEAAPETETAADPTAPAGPGFGSPAVEEGSGLNIGRDSAPSLGSPGSQVAVAAPEDTDAPAVSSDAPEVPDVTDDLTADEPDVEQDATPADVNERPLASAALVPGNALVDNAVPVEGNDDRPFFAIILQDIGDQGVLRDGLLALTASISFGVPVNDPDAPEISRLYREAGFEVVALLPESGPQVLKAGMSPEEVTANLGAFLSAVPDATAVLDRPFSDLPGSVELVDAVVSGLKVTGHGLLTYPATGLNSVADLAAGEGVPGVDVFRVIDEVAGEENIKLALDRAVVEAQARGGVVVVGSTRSETITTLFAWLLGTGSSRVKVVPASAAIQKLAQ